MNSRTKDTRSATKSDSTATTKPELTSVLISDYNSDNFIVNSVAAERALIAAEIKELHAQLALLKKQDAELVKRQTKFAAARAILSDAEDMLADSFSDLLQLLGNRGW